MTTTGRTAHRFIALTCAAVLSAGGLAACGDDDETTTGGAGGAQTTQTTPTTEGATATLQQTAVESGGLAFSEPDATVAAGSVTVTLDNPSENQLPHAIEIEGDGVEEETDTIQPGDEASVTVDLEPGEYRMYCPVGDHAAQGMEGTLTVE